MEKISIESWLESVRQRVVINAPDLLSLFDTYSEEAIFGRRFIDKDIQSLNIGSCILEVGAGSLLLAYQLVREGFIVSALEPIGHGFSHFKKMRQLIIDSANEKGYSIDLLDIPAESLVDEKRYEFAFSINVMEHVDDFDRVIERVSRSLKCRCIYHFTCPNYIFPYEPHFNIPTLFTKRLTFAVFRSKIYGTKKIIDPIGTWDSLNWISVLSVKKSVNSISDIEVKFDTQILRNTLERILVDKKFAERRSKWMCIAITLAKRCGMIGAIEKIPFVFQPSMDCRILRICT